MFQQLNFYGLLLVLGLFLVSCGGNNGGDDPAPVNGSELNGTWLYNESASTGPAEVSSFNGLSIDLEATESGLAFSFSVGAPNADVLAQSGTFTVSGGGFEVNQSASLTLNGTDFTLTRNQENRVTLGFTLNTANGRKMGIDGTYALVFDRQ